MDRPFGSATAAGFLSTGGVEMVELLAPASFRTDQAGLFEYVKVLRHRLAG